MKKVWFSILALALSLGFSSCGNNTEGKAKENISIVASVFPGYDWAREIVGDSNVDITLLLDNGVDIHSFQPTVEDIAKISECDMFIYVGGESDFALTEILEKNESPNTKVINMMEILGDSAKEEEIIEGMQEEAENEHGHMENEHGELEKEYDEHVWLSLKNAEIICNEINKGLCEIDNNNSEAYNKNTDEYIKKLSELDSKYKSAIDESKNKNLLFGDRFPFRYLVDDYGIEYYAAFPGCSAETEASFETIAYLSKKSDELGLKYVMAVDGSDLKIAKTIINSSENKNKEVLLLDSMPSVKKEELANGKTYLNTMENNLEVLKEALN